MIRQQLICRELYVSRPWPWVHRRTMVHDLDVSFRLPWVVISIQFSRRA